MNVFRLEISDLDQCHYQSTIIPKIENFLNKPVGRLEKRNIFMISCESEECCGKYLQHKKEVFFDEIAQREIDSFLGHEEEESFNFAIEITFKAGVTDNSGHSAVEALKYLKIQSEVSTGELYLLETNSDLEKLREMSKLLLANPLIQEIKVCTREEFLSSDRFKNVQRSSVLLEGDGEVLKLDLEGIDEKKFQQMNVERCLAMSWEEFKHVKNYYKEKLGNRKMTDVELEVIAQSWSEHCKHKIFSSHIDIEDEFGHEKKIEGLYKTFIKGSTKDIEKERNIDWLKSVFSDNAGVVRFDENLDICVKVETHNSPSALDPYGGALTGILGVNRDILGTGMGAKPIANTNVFCLGPIEYPLKGMGPYMPAGLLAPEYLLEGVHQGVVDGGNKSGIPTVNGAIFFDSSYAGKPLVYVGTVGVMPHKLKSGRKAYQKFAQAGDRVVIVGGAVGADGIHGATFSSLELNESSPSTAVQIGDPLMQKRVTDFLLAAREKELFSALTDNGAGGLSSSVGEMAIMTGGASIDLALCTLKYPGLLPYEIMISESQERMSFSVPPSSLNEFIELAKDYGVVASDLGEFTQTGYLEIKYQENVVANLDLHFLHDSLPPMKLKAKWNGPMAKESWLPQCYKKALPKDLNRVLNELLHSANIASKEKFVRQYDHGVQASTLIRPFTGKNDGGTLGPNNSSVVWLYPHGGKRDNAISIGCGMAPRMSYLDPELMAYYAVDEAVRNVVCTGGDIDKLCLLDNFCWPDPVLAEGNENGDLKLGALVKTCEGLSTITKAYGTPLVSGKDSMKNDFKGKNKRGEKLKISILPTLLITAVAKASTQHLMTSEFKKAGDFIYHLGRQELSFAGSELDNTYTLPDFSLPSRPNLEENYKLYKKINEMIRAKLIESLHDISDGGPLCALCESCMGGELGADLKIDGAGLMQLFGEGPGQFIASVSKERALEFEKLLGGTFFQKIGQVTREKKIRMNDGQTDIIFQDVKDLEAKFRSKF